MFFNQCLDSIDLFVLRSIINIYIFACISEIKQTMKAMTLIILAIIFNKVPDIVTNATMNMMTDNPTSFINALCDSVVLFI